MIATSRAMPAAAWMRSPGRIDPVRMASSPSARPNGKAAASSTGGWPMCNSVDASACGGGGQQHAGRPRGAARRQREQQCAAEGQLPRQVVAAQIRRGVRGDAERGARQLQRVGSSERVEGGELRVAAGEPADHRGDSARDQHHGRTDAFRPAHADLVQAATAQAQGRGRPQPEQNQCGAEAHGVVRERRRFAARKQPGQRRDSRRGHRQRVQGQPDGRRDHDAGRLGPPRPADHRDQPIIASRPRPRSRPRRPGRHRSGAARGPVPAGPPPARRRSARAAAPPRTRGPTARTSRSRCGR